MQYGFRSVRCTLVTSRSSTTADACCADSFLCISSVVSRSTSHFLLQIQLRIPSSFTLTYPLRTMSSGPGAPLPLLPAPPAPAAGCQRGPAALAGPARGIAYGGPPLPPGAGGAGREGARLYCSGASAPRA